MGDDAFLEPEDLETGNAIEVSADGRTVTFVGPAYAEHRKAIERENAKRREVGLSDQPMTAVETLAFIKAMGINRP